MAPSVPGLQAGQPSATDTDRHKTTSTKPRGTLGCDQSSLLSVDSSSIWEVIRKCRGSIGHKHVLRLVEFIMADSLNPVILVKKLRRLVPHITLHEFQRLEWPLVETILCKLFEKLGVVTLKQCCLERKQDRVAERRQSLSSRARKEREDIYRRIFSSLTVKELMALGYGAPPPDRVRRNIACRPQVFYRIVRFALDVMPDTAVSATAAGVDRNTPDVLDRLGTAAREEEAKVSVNTTRRAAAPGRTRRQRSGSGKRGLEANLPSAPSAPSLPSVGNHAAGSRTSRARRSSTRDSTDAGMTLTERPSTSAAATSAAVLAAPERWPVAGPGITFGPGLDMAADPLSSSGVQHQQRTNSATITALKKRLRHVETENDLLRQQLEERQSTLDQLLGEDSAEQFDRRRVRLLKAQNMQLERQIQILQEACDWHAGAQEDVQGCLRAIQQSLRNFARAAAAPDSRVDTVSACLQELETRIQTAMRASIRAKSSRLKFGWQYEHDRETSWLGLSESSASKDSEALQTAGIRPEGIHGLNDSLISLRDDLLALHSNAAQLSAARMPAETVSLIHRVLERCREMSLMSSNADSACIAVPASTAFDNGPTSRPGTHDSTTTVHSIPGMQRVLATGANTWQKLEAALADRKLTSAVARQVVQQARLDQHLWRQHTAQLMMELGEHRALFICQTEALATLLARVQHVFAKFRSQTSSLYKRLCDGVDEALSLWNSKPQQSVQTMQSVLAALHGLRPCFRPVLLDWADALGIEAPSTAHVPLRAPGSRRRFSTANDGTDDQAMLPPLLREFDMAINEACRHFYHTTGRTLQQIVRTSNTDHDAPPATGVLPSLARTVVHTAHVEHQAAAVRSHHHESPLTDDFRTREAPQESAALSPLATLSPRRPHTAHQTRTPPRPLRSKLMPRMEQALAQPWLLPGSPGRTVLPTTDIDLDVSRWLPRPRTHHG